MSPILLYILDAQRAKSLFIYDREGRLKKVIDNIGNGPGEFKFNTYVNSFITINNDDIILDKGNFISDESTNYIRIINKEGDKITELLPVPEFVREITISPRNPLQENRDTILFMPSLSNNIYQIYDKKIEVRYQLDFGKSILFYHSESEEFPIATAGTSFVWVQYIEDKNPGLIFFDVAW